MIEPTDTARDLYRRQRQEHWDTVARRTARSEGLSSYYHARLRRLYQLAIPPGLKILELGCGQGNLLASLQPSLGVGVDFSGHMLSVARQKHPDLRFIRADVHELELAEKFDVIILSDLVNDVWDVQQVLDRARAHSLPGTRLILNFFNAAWQPPLSLARRLHLAQPLRQPNWLAPEDVDNLLYLAGFGKIHHSQEVLWPLRTPIVDSFFNKFLVRLWPFRLAALAHLVVASPVHATTDPPGKPMTVSIIVPARNESGNVPTIFARVPELGAGTELIFVEGHSNDETYAAIERATGENPARKARLLRQSGKGKGDAVRAGFAEATGEILMILDADLTVAPEELHRFYDAIASGKAEFVNGVRLVYPMEKQAMRFLNLLGNKLFSLVFSWLLGQSVKDTLCGTKVLRKSDYEKIAANRRYFGDFDPFGDFDLLFGAAKLNLKIVDVPIRYRERTYGATNIQRFRHGLLLLRMTFFAARRLKFV